jgi:hypothetical protein
MFHPVDWLVLFLLALADRPIESELRWDTQTIGRNVRLKTNGFVVLLAGGRILNIESGNLHAEAMMTCTTDASVEKSGGLNQLMPNSPKEIERTKLSAWP